MKRVRQLVLLAGIAGFALVGYLSSCGGGTAQPVHAAEQSVRHASGGPK